MMLTKKAGRFSEFSQYVLIAALLGTATLLSGSRCTDCRRNAESCHAGHGSETV